MRIPLVAGNWKMNKTVAEARELVSKMNLPLREIKGVEKVLCPPFMSLLAVSALLEGSAIGLGAQNMHWEEKGAFTGEVSPVMLKEFCQYVILGHSERRTYFGETDEIVNRKLRAATVIPGDHFHHGLGIAYEAGRLGHLVLAAPQSGFDSRSRAKRRQAQDGSGQRQKGGHSFRVGHRA